MSSNETNKNCTSYPEFKFPISRSLNNKLLEEIPSLTPQKDIFLHIKPQINKNSKISEKVSNAMNKEKKQKISPNININKKEKEKEKILV